MGEALDRAYVADPSLTLFDSERRQKGAEGLERHKARKDRASIDGIAGLRSAVQRLASEVLQEPTSLGALREIGIYLD